MPKNNYHGSNINYVKLHNLQMILLILLHDRNISRVQLAQKTNLSTSAISNLVNELLKQGIVSENDQEEPAATELRSVGRPRASIHLEPNARYVIGLHIGVGLFRICIANLLGELLFNHIEYFDVSDPATTVLDQMTTSIETMIITSNLERTRILGVGVGASGLVDFETGINILAPNLNWHNIPLRDYLSKKLQLPVVVDNNVRTMAIGEKYFGVGKDVDSLIFVYARIGVGAGLIYKGEVFRGNTAGAGEIGHTIMLPEGGEACRCGNRGCLETLVSETAIVNKAKKIALSNPGGIFGQLSELDSNLTLIEKVFKAAREGDIEIRKLLEKRAYYLGVAMAGMVNLFNPEMILLGGIYGEAPDLFLDSVIETVHEKAFGGMGKKVQMQETSFGWKAGVLGAAALGLMHFFYQQTITVN